MCHLISVHSIRKANNDLTHNKSTSFTSDGATASIRYYTLSSRAMLRIPVQRIIEAAMRKPMSYK